MVIKEEDNARLDTFRSECQQAIENAKSSYLRWIPPDQGQFL